MPLQLRHRINEGMRIIEHPSKEDEKNGKVEDMVVDVVVRDIISTDKGAIIGFEVIEEGGVSQVFDLPENGRYNVLPTCTLYIPRNPIKDRPLSCPDNVEVDYDKRAYIGYKAPRNVIFSRRRFYRRDD